MTSADDKNSLPARPVLPAEERPWPVKALTVLLFVQSVGLLTIAAYNFITLDFGEVPASEIRLALLSGMAANSIAFSALSLLSLLAALSFFGLWRNAWLNAMLVQGLTLLVALVMYAHAQGERFYVFLMMVYGIFMVVYLHHPDVQATFQPKVAPDRPEEEVP